MHNRLKSGEVNGHSLVDYFPEMEDFLAYVAPADYRTLHLPAADSEASRWNGDVSYQEAVDLARDGMPADPEIIELRDRLTGRVRVAKVVASFLDVAGGSEFDVGLVNAGVPESVWNYREESGRSRRTLALLCSTSAGGACSSEWMRLRGAAYMALVDCLEKSGQFKCAVYSVTASKSRYKSDGIIPVVRLKEPGRHYDPNTLAFALSHTAWQRRLCFGYQDILPEAGALQVTAADFYGTDFAPDHDDLAAVLGETEDVLDLMEPANYDTEDFWNMKSAQRWIEKILRSYNLLDETK